MIRNALFRSLGVAAAAAWLSLAVTASSDAFCGFYVAKADTKIFNRASQVVLVRDEDRTVVTMVNDFRGDPREFAVVVPVPTVLAEGQIHVGDKAVVEHLDAYTSPRLVEYFDGDPCAPVYPMAAMRAEAADGASRFTQASERAKSLGVAIEASYTVGEYDILILSAKESAGLETWLRENGYRIPDGAAPVLGSYLKQGMKFFVAKVNLEEQAKLGFQSLRPLQVAYESPKFMLPIRLGTVNAEGPQELFVYALTRKGRVETTNYRTVKLPTGDEIPPFVKDDFARFYRAMFDEQTRRERGAAVFLEYAWDMAWCDPCAADPLTPKELRDLGVFWVPAPSGESGPRDARSPRIAPPPFGAPVDVFVTRLHVRYDRDAFPEDLVFQTTGDRENFQGRYVLRHAFAGEATCDAGVAYRRGLPKRFEDEARRLANLTGWDIAEIRERLPRVDGVEPARAADDERTWWERLWGSEG
ncbi:MAG: DUF2330 domain-containing protein [Myxococcota bacterium]|nr:DUF2330 domain-containing protein [Myxococcales bacterium]